MENSFKCWLNEHENIELQVGNFLEDMLDKAGKLSHQDQHSQPFTVYLSKVWPQSHAGFLLPAHFPQGIAGLPISFKELPEGTRAKSIHVGNKFAGMILSSKNLPNELDALKSAVHHEAEHIMHPGADYTPGGEDHTIAYISNPGEMRAHAREMARLFAKSFPGEQFDLNKAQSLLPQLNQTHRNIFSVMSDPKIAQKHGLQNNPHQQIISLVQSFLPQYN